MLGWLWFAFNGIYWTFMSYLSVFYFWDVILCLSSSIFHLVSVKFKGNSYRIYFNYSLHGKELLLKFIIFSILDFQITERLCVSFIELKSFFGNFIVYWLKIYNRPFLTVISENLPSFVCQSHLSFSKI